MTTRTITKRFGPYPAAHRQHNHSGHCRLIHGHNWTFEVTFKSAVLDPNGFVVDFGDFKDLKQEFERLFDHTFLVNHDDPQLAEFGKLHDAGLARVVIVPSGSAEGIASLVHATALKWVYASHERSKRGVFVDSATVFEDDKNSATFNPH